VLVLTNHPVYPLTLAKVRIIGVLDMWDSDENDRKLIGVYDSDPRFKEYNDISDIAEYKLKEIIHFFETYKELQDKVCEIKGVLNKKEAHKDIQRAKKMAEEKIKPKKIKKRFLF
jgi:inorganic pyrophosphatase